MSDNAGSNSRVVDVINFLAAHPTDAFTLSQLAEQLDLSLGSAHRVLTMLTDARYLSRHPKHKTYSLGMALVAVGRAALEKHRGIDIARREMARLTEELNAQCFAAAVVDDELLLLAKEGLPQTRDGVSYVGERRPFVPPLGLAHVAWADAEAVDAFFAKVPADIDADTRAHLHRSLDLVRQRGYAIAANGPALTALRQTTSVPIGHRRDDAYWARVHKLIANLSTSEIQLLDFEQPVPAGVGYISAPVFSPTGEVALELTLSGIPSNLGADDIARYAERLRTAAAVVTSESHGRMPR